eukprot:464115_1
MVINICIHIHLVMIQIHSMLLNIIQIPTGGIWLKYKTDTLIFGYDIYYNYKLRVEVTDNMFVVYLDNKYLFTYIDIENKYPFGSVGLLNNNCKSTFKSLRVVFGTNNVFIKHAMEQLTTTGF